MKTTLVIVFFLLIGKITLASTESQLDSLRKIVLQPKLQNFTLKISNYVSSIKSETDKKKIKQLAEEIIEASDELMYDVRCLYGYKQVSTINPVYVGANVQTTLYPNVGGFIFPTTYSTVGSLPHLYDHLAYIKDYAWRIRLKTSSALITRNLARIERRNSSLVNG